MRVDGFESSIKQKLVVNLRIKRNNSVFSDGSWEGLLALPKQEEGRDWCPTACTGGYLKRLEIKYFMNMLEHLH